MKYLRRQTVLAAQLAYRYIGLLSNLLDLQLMLRRQATILALGYLFRSVCGTPATAQSLSSQAKPIVQKSVKLHSLLALLLLA